MLNVTPPCALVDTVTVNVAVIVPLWPSVTDTSSIDTVGVTGPPSLSGVSEKSSTARPSSAPVALKSVHRIQKVVPGGMPRPSMTLSSAVRFAAAWPSSAPIAAVVFGAVKSRAFDVDPCAGRQAGGVEAVLKIDAIGAAGGTQTPLFTGVRNRQAA